MFLRTLVSFFVTRACAEVSGDIDDGGNLGRPLSIFERDFDTPLPSENDVRHFTLLDMWRTFLMQYFDHSA